MDDNPRLETIDECERRNQQRADNLVYHLPEIAIALEASTAALPSGLITCALSSRRFRRAFMRKLHKLHKADPRRQEFATIYLDSIPEGSLEAFDLKAAIERFRKRLLRSGFRGSMLAGGVEVAWLYRSRSWLLHVHVVTFGVPISAWEALELKLAGSDSAEPLRHEPLTRPKTRISYALKFVTYYKTGRTNADGGEEKKPLWRRQLIELARFWSHYEFNNFVFLYGAYPRGEHFEAYR